MVERPVQEMATSEKVESNVVLSEADVDTPLEMEINQELTALRDVINKKSRMNRKNMKCNVVLSKVEVHAPLEMET